jgi:cytochrome c peroxidase
MCRSIDRWRARLVGAALIFGLQAGAAAADPAFTPDEIRRIASHGPWPPPRAYDAGNAYARRPAAVALGQRLFIDPRLSAPGTVACASCHAPGLAFADGRARSIGIAEVERNAPSLIDAVHERWMGWDGAADSLWSQALRALTDAREMASSGAHLRLLIEGDARLAADWRMASGSAASSLDDEALLVATAKIIAAYVGSLVSARTPFDDFRAALLRGDAAAAARYPADARRGLQLFIGRGRCHLCHVGPRFSHGEFADIGLPFFSRPGVVDPGRHAGIAALKASPYNRLSRWADAPVDRTQTLHVEATHRNFGEFKVPTLRGVADTAPYMHDGQLATLQDVLRHYSELDVERIHSDGERLLEPLKLSDGETADLLAFLRSLSPKLKPAAARDPRAPSRRE